MRRSALARLLFFSGAAAVLAAGAVALAAGDDRAAAEALLRDIESSPRKDVAEPLTARARAALDRSAKLRAGGADRASSHRAAAPPARRAPAAPPPAGRHRRPWIADAS